MLIFNIQFWNWVDGNKLDGLFLIGTSILEEPDSEYKE